MKELYSLVACLALVVVEGAKIDLVYQVFGKNVNCLNPCVTQGSVSRCSSDGKTIDLCNANTTVAWVEKKFTNNNGPCKDECTAKKEAGKVVYTCNHYFKGSDYCDHQLTHRYVQGQTVNKEFCVGKCQDHDFDGRRWCYHGEDKKRADCALPATPKPRDWSAFLNKLSQYKESFTVQIPTGRGKRQVLTSNELQELAVDLERDTEFQYVYILPADRSSDDPINSYTIKRGDFANRRPWVPRVLRATVFPRHLRASAGRERAPPEIDTNMQLMGKFPGDHAGHLVAYTLSGPFVIQNFVPQLSNVNLSAYARLEGKIRKFLRDHNTGRVEMLVVPVYRRGETRPFGIGTLFRFTLEGQDQEVYFNYIRNE